MCDRIENRKRKKGFKNHEKEKAKTPWHIRKDDRRPAGVSGADPAGYNGKIRISGTK